MDKNKDKLLQNAQYRKGLSIAFFNATNNALEMMKLMFQGKDFSGITSDEFRSALIENRNWLLEEHKNYYATVISNVGKNYNAEDTIKNLKLINNKEDLANMWLSISADERADKEIQKVVRELKKSYEKA